MVPMSVPGMTPPPGVIRNLDRVRDARTFDWPWWMPVGSGVSALLIALAAAQGHGILTLSEAVPAAVLAAAPFVVAATRRLLLPAWLAIPFVLLGVYALEVPPPPTGDVAPMLLVLLTAHTACIGRRWEGAAAALASIALMSWAEIRADYEGAAVWAFGIGMGWVSGFLIQHTLRLLADLKEAQTALLEQATADERRRIAREVHDVVAHSLAVTMLNLSGARLALAGSDPEAAREALEEAERLGRQSLTDIRRTVGLLGGTDGVAAAAPSGEGVDALVESYRSAGLEVTATVDPRVRDLAPAVGLTVYRIVQEALANVVKHAPGSPAELELTCDGELRLRVRSRLNGSPNGDGGGGLGIGGMRDRAGLVGGELTAGPTGDGWWCVELVVPLVKEPA